MTPVSFENAAGPPLVMAVDDEEDNLEFLQRALAPTYEVRTFTSPQTALEALRKDTYALIISDHRMPGMNGVEFLGKAAISAPDAARVLLTAYADLRTALDAVNNSRVSAILTKPVEVMVLTAEVDRCIAYRKLFLMNRSLTYDLARSNQDLTLAKKMIETDLDVRSQELLAANRRLEQLAIRDGLTGLYNHRHFQERLEQEIAASLRHGHPLSLMFGDVDYFKTYNDNNGHPAGDELLRRVARIMQESTRGEEMLARYGGEEFVLLLPSTPIQGALTVAERLRESIANEDFPGSKTQPSGKVTVSLGVASCPRHGKSAKDLLSAADQAVYRAKVGGRNRVVSAEEQAAAPAGAAAPQRARDLSPERRIELRERALARERALREEAERLLEDRTRELYLANEQLIEQQAVLIQTEVLVQTEKMSALGRMSAGVAHEVNNALNFMRGNSQILPKYIGVYQELLGAYQREAGAAMTPEALERLRGLERATRVAFIAQDLPKLLNSIGIGLERATSIVRDLGAFSRSDDSTEMEEVDLRRPMEIGLTLAANRLKNKAEVVREYGETGPRARCHPGKISQVYLNLLLNAADAVLPGGHIRIELAPRDGRAVATIADDGPGIDPDHQRRLFEPFFTTKPAGEGTGLGLFMCKKIIEEHGGEIRCESEPGKGTTFRVSLPLAEGKP